jgi:hypothetical protein
MADDDTLTKQVNRNGMEEDVSPILNSMGPMKQSHYEHDDAQDERRKMRTVWACFLSLNNIGKAECCRGKLKFKGFRIG